MPHTHRRVPNPTTRDSGIIDVNAHARQVIDVDLQHLKYEFNEEEDGIESIDRETFLQNVQRNRGDEMGRMKQNITPAQHATPIGAHNRVGTVDYPSSIGPAIQNLRMQRKRVVSSPHDAQNLSANKRRKIGYSPSPSISFSSTSPTSKVRVTGLNKSNYETTSSSKVDQRNSADIAFADVPNLPDSSMQSRTFARQAISRTRNTNVNNENDSNTMGHGVGTGQTTERMSEPVELSSDGEEEVVTPKRKKKDRTNLAIPPIRIAHDYPQPEMESTDEGDWDPPGFDLNDSTRWKPLKLNTNRLEDSVNNLAFEQLRVDNPAAWHPSRSPYRHPDTSKWAHKSLRRDNASTEFIWDHLSRIVHSKRRALPNIPRIPYSRPWNLDFPFHRLQSAHSFKEAPGAITRIEQKGCWTAIASACDGGGPDEENERPSDYNRPGTLMTWNNGFEIPEGHQTKRLSDCESDGIVKHYAVHDVKFDPIRQAFVSSGADMKTRLWTLSEQTEDMDPNVRGQLAMTSRWKQEEFGKYSRAPHELVFQQNASILAVAERKVHIFAFSEDTIKHTSSFQLHSRKESHLIGAMAWGIQCTENLLFASSEPEPSVPPNPPVFEGLHKVYDVANQSLLYNLDATEAGDTLALNPPGAILALSTRAPENRHILRLYDVSRQEPKAMAEINLEVFPTYLEGEVNCATFSPDGLCIALARNDNRVDIYDVRMLDRGPLFEYEHFGESKAPSQECVFGAVKAQWLHSGQTRRMALLTAGEDGCVRLWNPLMSSDDAMNGRSVAEVNSDIGYFSLGDQFAGEHQLVVGDCAGEVTIFDNVIV